VVSLPLALDIRVLGVVLSRFSGSLRISYTSWTYVWSQYLCAVQYKAWTNLAKLNRVYYLSRRMLVRVMFQRKFVIGFLDDNICSILADIEGGVVVGDLRFLWLVVHHARLMTYR
jgi:hypothetical protein